MSLKLVDLMVMAISILILLTRLMGYSIAPRDVLDKIRIGCTTSLVYAGVFSGYARLLLKK
jgi:hypothetical protein